MLPHIHSDLLRPSSLVSDVAPKMTSERKTAGVLLSFTRVSAAIRPVAQLAMVRGANLEGSELNLPGSSFQQHPDGSHDPNSHGTKVARAFLYISGLGITSEKQMSCLGEEKASVPYLCGILTK